MGSGLKSAKRKSQRGADRIVQFPKDHRVPGNKEYEYYRWCVNNGIIIWPIPELSNNWYIRITINGKTNKSPVKYGDDIWDKVYEYYKYYYDKYKTND